MTNNADSDQLASEEANWSGSTLFAKAGYIYLGSAGPLTRVNELIQILGLVSKGVKVSKCLGCIW